MTETLVEALARAVCKWDCGHSENCPNCVWRDFVDQMRAALSELDRLGYAVVPKNSSLSPRDAPSAEHSTAVWVGVDGLGTPHWHTAHDDLDECVARIQDVVREEGDVLLRPVYARVTMKKITGGEPRGEANTSSSSLSASPKVGE